ncbi:phage portal protein, PBSX family [Novosphingobium nitrogenifigens DSM 19370]|uniref:Phage portal protein, PBSX family n=1 Tax=Novosphingobium nitrogenifigens DSM 19370 TaxID=983920 RepID=F1ZAI7_9SPHN|nr:phage portal protein [Novosphingobium nitrogenifigens]EGD58405.1 phage portal protein, PBSX family [Novosphingobium nitrogenifigens DSM 19370]
MDPTQPLEIPGEYGFSVMSFGEPESVLARDQFFDLFQVVRNARWYDPPVSQIGIGRAYRMAPHHQSCILLKRNLLSASFQPSPLFTRSDFARWALDWLIFGNAYLQVVPSMVGKAMALKPSPAAWTRVGLTPGAYWFVQPNQFLADAYDFAPGTVHHMYEPDPLQEIYGMPEYLSALQSGLLNESATIFRRRYYLNGAHAGFILYVSEEAMSQADSEALGTALRQAKGPGNFRNILIHIPKGKKDGVQILPIAEVAAKDEFLAIKEVTRDDMLAAHRVPPQLLGIVPKNGTGFGNVIDAARTFYQLEIVPIQQRMLELNAWLGFEAVRFAEPQDIAGLAPAGVGARA